MERYVIHVTKKCNLDCMYCYEKDKSSEYTWEEIKNVIDNIVESSPSDSFGIEFLGGEPMLEWDYIVKSYEYLEGREDVTISDYVITTNGTIITDKIVDYLSKNKRLIFAISLDGNKLSNQLRVFKESGVNSYDKVMENVKVLLENNVDINVHTVSHPYNIGILAESILHLHNQGINSIDVGTIESTMQIDEEYCDRFIKELDFISKKIADGTYPDLRIGLFDWLKPESDVRSYIRDPETGKVVAESYGRNGNDITHSDKYDVKRCTEKTSVSKMIHYIRRTVYENHHKRLKEANSNDN